MSDIKDSQGPSSGHIYLVDADVLTLIEQLADSTRIYNRLIALAGARRVRTVRQVFDELRKAPSAYAMLKSHREVFQIPIAEQLYPPVGDLITILGDEMPGLWEQTGSGKNPDPADPWLVAVASAYDYTVVTNESPRSPKRIPAACQLPKINCRCISGPHFLIEVGLAEMKPEHISPAEFFSEKKPK